MLDELQAGRKHGIDVPDLTTATWIEIRQPASIVALELVMDMGGVRPRF